MLARFSRSERMSSKASFRREFSSQFKAEAVQMVLETDESVAGVDHDLQISRLSRSLQTALRCSSPQYQRLLDAGVLSHAQQQELADYKASVDAAHIAGEIDRLQQRVIRLAASTTRKLEAVIEAAKALSDPSGIKTRKPSAWTISRGKYLRRHALRTWTRVRGLLCS